VLIGLILGGLITFAFQAHAERVTYKAESMEVQVEEKATLVVEKKEKSIEEKVREAFADAPTMIAVARCESNFKNIKGRWSNDYGPFQINYVHLPRLRQLGLDRTNVDDNIAFARILFQEQGTRPWYMSKGCWGV
jgi:hypothetical protein